MEEIKETLLSYSFGLRLFCWRICFKSGMVRSRIRVTQEGVSYSPTLQCALSACQKTGAQSLRSPSLGPWFSATQTTVKLGISSSEISAHTISRQLTHLTKRLASKGRDNSSLLLRGRSGRAHHSAMKLARAPAVLW